MAIRQLVFPISTEYPVWAPKRGRLYLGSSIILQRKRASTWTVVPEAVKCKREHLVPVTLSKVITKPKQWLPLLETPLSHFNYHIMEITHTLSSDHLFVTKTFRSILSSNLLEIIAFIKIEEDYIPGQGPGNQSHIIQIYLQEPRFWCFGPKKQFYLL